MLYAPLDRARGILAAIDIPASLEAIDAAGRRVIAAIAILRTKLTKHQGDQWKGCLCFT